MKPATNNAKAPFGTAKFARIKNVRYLSWEDAFDVEFEDGLCILEPHRSIRKVNKISPKSKFDHLEIEDGAKRASSCITTTVRLRKFRGHSCGRTHLKSDFILLTPFRI